MSEYITEWYWDERRNAPNQDQREPIVRCRDCAYYSGENDEIYQKWCMEMNAEGIEPDGFCAWGERKADA